MGNLHRGGSRALGRARRRPRQTGWTPSLGQQAENSKGAPALNWKCGPNARIEGNLLIVDVPVGEENAGGLATADLDLSAWDGRPVGATVIASGAGISKPLHWYNGLKFQFEYEDADSREMPYPNTPARLGDFPEQAIRLRDFDGMRRRKARVGVRLLESGGESAAVPASGVEAPDAGASEATVDSVAGLFRVVSRCTTGGFTEGGRMECGPLAFSLSVSGGACPAAVWVSSLDGAPIEDSSRLLLTHLTDAKNAGMTFDGPDMLTTLDFGSAPALVRRGRATAKRSFARSSPPPDLRRTSSVRPRARRRATSAGTSRASPPSWPRFRRPAGFWPPTTRPPRSCCSPQPAAGFRYHGISPSRESATTWTSAKPSAPR